MRYASLRYFNAAGGTPERGEAHNPETHLIPLVLQVALGQRPSISIYGTDYPTKDGTCIRDYIHIEDLATAHLLALDGLEQHSRLICNLGSGSGFSVREIIDVARKSPVARFAVVESPRRRGRPGGTGGQFGEDSPGAGVEPTTLGHRKHCPFRLGVAQG